MKDTCLHLQAPLSEDDARSLRAGDRVLLSGVIHTARDAAHRRMIDLIQQGGTLPLDLEGQVIYYAGPSPAPPGRPVGSIGPTTSGRMDAFTLPLLARGLRGMIGKGRRSPEVIEALGRTGAVYFGAVGGAAAVLATHVVRAETVLWDDLGPEAVRRLEIREFPLIVINDTRGGDWYAMGVADYLKRVES